MTARAVEKPVDSGAKAVSTKKKVYFLKGHGEAAPNEDKGPGASAVRGGLEDENVTVAELLLANEAAVPAAGARATANARKDVRIMSHPMP